MTGVAYQLNQNQAKDIEIVVHIDEELGESNRGELTEYLTSTDGVSAAEFCPLRFHLMLVQYDRDRISSQDIIQRINSRRVNAQLIGPI
jgi:hypothetical protein